MKFCRDCRQRSSTEFASCRRYVKKASLVTGSSERFSCFEARYNENLCGENAVGFERYNTPWEDIEGFCVWLFGLKPKKEV